MQITKIISSATVERLKQKARKLKREKSIPHTQALDEIAVTAGFNHWNQVVQANDVLKPSEVALSGSSHLRVSEVCINPVPEDADQATVEKGVNFPTLKRAIEKIR